MSTTLTTATTDVTVTADQLDLIKRTIAVGATADELKLYLYDCARQGVHPLDKLIHYTKRSGKYTPITSIDFMRIRAADTGDYAGSDDAHFDAELLPSLAPDHSKPPRAASVTVWRLVQGQRCAFTATARWSEYKPEANDFMWKKMPHTMLAKCAEALALRKGFPRQLAGLYAKEEMDQAEKPSGYMVEAPAIRAGRTAGVDSNCPSVPNGGDSGTYYQPEAVSVVDTASVARQALMAGIRADLPDALYIERLTQKPTKNPNVTKYTLVLSDGREVNTIRDRMAGLAEQLCQDREPVRVTTEHGKYGEDLLTLERDVPPATETELTSADIAF